MHEKHVLRVMLAAIIGVGLLHFVEGNRGLCITTVLTGGCRGELLMSVSKRLNEAQVVEFLSISYPNFSVDKLWPEGQRDLPCIARIANGENRLGGLLQYASWNQFLRALFLEPTSTTQKL
jgi:hypothetical protein